MANLKHILDLLEHGKVAEARAALAAVPRSDPDGERLRQRVRDLMLRKFQRQAKVAEFLAEAGPDPRLRLAGARLAGTLAELAAAAPNQPWGQLAGWASGDLRAGLASLRRLPDHAELAQGWMAVLRGDLAQAVEQFTRTPAGQQRRAQCGLAVAAALGGDAATVESRLAGLGPFPHTCFPATAALLHQLSRRQQEFSPARLPELLQSSKPETMQRLYEACPTAQNEVKAWLALRLGDLRWTAATGGDQRAPALWQEAARRHPALLADVLKRLLLAADTRQQPVPGTWLVHRSLAKHDPALSRRVVDAVMMTWTATACAAQAQLLVDETDQTPAAELPVELLLLHFRSLEVHRSSMSADATPRMDRLRPLLARCDVAYAGELVWLRTKLLALGRASQHGERRKSCLAALLAQPQCAPEILPTYLEAARRDQRAKRQVAEEFIRLRGVLGDDPDLAVLGVQTGNLTVATVQARWPAALATTILFLAHQAQAKDLPALGHDEAVDMLATLDSSRLTKGQLDQLLGDRERLHRLLRRHQRRLAMIGDPAALLARWRDRFPGDWQPHFHAGARARLRDDPDLAANAWGRAMDLEPGDVMERSEMGAWLDLNQHWGGADDGLGGDADDFTDHPDFTDIIDRALQDLIEREALPPAPQLPPRRKAPKPPPAHTDPLVPPAAALHSFQNQHGPAQTQRIMRLIDGLSLGTNRHVDQLADQIPVADRAAACAWLELLQQHNHRLLDLSTLSAIAVVVARLHVLRPR